MVEDICSKTSKTSFFDHSNFKWDNKRLDVINKQIPITGIVVTYNEERHLRECLDNLSFCEQLMVIDLGSLDASREIAKECGAEVINHERVSIVEQIWTEVIVYARNDWIALVDPDEIVPPNIETDLIFILSNEHNIGAISFPIQYYFKNIPLHFSFWGNESRKRFLLHRSRNIFKNNVHRGVETLNGFRTFEIPRKRRYYIKHYWVDSYNQLFKKHWRYIRTEGQSRFNHGERFYWSSWLRETIGSLKYSLIKCRGIGNGFLGFFLSFFYSVYISMSLLSLYRYQKMARKRKLR